MLPTKRFYTAKTQSGHRQCAQRTAPRALDPFQRSSLSRAHYLALSHGVDMKRREFIVMLGGAAVEITNVTQRSSLPVERAANVRQLAFVLDRCSLSVGRERTIIRQKS